MQADGPIVLIVGTRPEAIKMMPVYVALKEAGYPVQLCSTMQHDQLLYDVLDLFGMVPDVDLGVMRIGQDLFYVTQSLLQKTKEYFKKVNPSLVLVQGDTTSAMVSALSAFYLQIPVGHIEAGLRTYDNHAPFPEEMNRRVLATLAALHFAPTQEAVQHLQAEHIAPEAIIYTGNTVVDALRIVKEQIAQDNIRVSERIKNSVQRCKQQGKLCLLTMHRRESFSGGLQRILNTFTHFLREHPDVFCIYPYHPNPYVVHALQESGFTECKNGLLFEPLSYQDLVHVLDNADFVITDSGGIQEEAISLGKQVLVLREKTERQEGIASGLATLVGTDEKKLHIGLHRLIKSSAPSQPLMLYGDGYAAEKIVRIIKQKHAAPERETFLAAQNISSKRMNDEEAMKKVAVLGLGYIGLPTSVVLAETGYDVFGYDVDNERIAAINRGEAVIQEPDLFEKLQIALSTGRFSAGNVIKEADYFIIAVPTPFKEEKRADLSYVFAAAAAVASVLKKGDTIILESTVPVGATDQLAAYLHEKSDLQPGLDFYVAHCPERVLPGNIFKELIENDRIIGGINQASVYKAKELYDSFVAGGIYLTDAKTAEMVKLIENSSRDVQIAFAHQVASMAYSIGLNPYEVIELANKHPRVQILKPSSGVGGHCIAVDPWFLIETFQDQTKLLQAARQVNDMRPLELLEYIYKAARQWYAQHQTKCKLLLMGLTYKPDVDDLRESPALRIANMVSEHNAIELLVCEPHINQKKLAAVYGSSAVTVMDGIEQADIIVFLVAHTRFKAIDQKLLEGKKVLDFCGVREKQTNKQEQEKLYWPASSLQFFMPEMQDIKQTRIVKQELL